MKSTYETLNSREFIWKVVCEIVAFLSREGWVKTCFVVSLWVNHACIFALSSASFTLVQLACSSWVSGSVPLRRGRDNAVAVQWHWPAAVAPRSCSQESGSNALVGRLCRARRAVLGFELVLPGIMRPLSYPPTLRAVLWHTRLWVQWCHWWLIYILNELSIFHIIFVWIHDVVKHNSRCASVCYDLKSNLVEITDSHVALCK